MYKSQGWREIENRVLALVQLWADTFMMHEDKYPCFMRTYRELRKESLPFPKRDPNERFMIKFEGEPSPAFELAEMEGQFHSEPSAPPQRAPEPQENEEPKLLRKDVESLKSNLPKLEEQIACAREMRDLQEPRVKELVRKCRQSQKQLIVFVSHRAENSTEEGETEELLRIMDYVNSKMESFKKAASAIKRNASKEEIMGILKPQGSEDPLSLLGDDFLEVPENPLEDLFKYVYGSEPFKPDEEQKEELKEELKEEEKQEEEVQPHQGFRKLEPPPDLLLDEAEDESPANGVSASSNPYDLTSILFSAEEKTQPQSMPQQSMPQQYMPQQGMPQQGMPQQSMPQQGMPQQSMPQQSMPQQYMPQQPMPQAFQAPQQPWYGAPQGFPQGNAFGFPNQMPNMQGFAYPNQYPQGLPQNLNQGPMNYQEPPKQQSSNPFAAHDPFEEHFSDL
eukprot:CAMPEP_0202435656 /NCGR_PEP_ID=MMETSP1345-20130828/20878_1 /ASSEMBLY_ACC=CAM_ASM_000843 /TAXON_ID=342563 /ORGANISM="Fabrea Fabrea salina" /LENGTH=449 /DNA_ID=CAMNT_0049048747 /DNA_START=315 /DNA_END=1661 /DNA_ORIENTATION=-